MIKFVDIESIKPAPYNPRRISDKQTEKLKKSLTNLGFCIPVLINAKNNIILAGHQRTRAARMVGIKKVPVIFVENMNLGDEIKFNQIHNITDTSKDVVMKVTGSYEEEKFIEISYEKFSDCPTTTSCVKEICILMSKYGNVLSAVICDGEVILGREYIRACKIFRKKVNAYILPKEKKELAKGYFSENYGEYCYEGIERHTYVQGLAQMFRNPNQNEIRKNISNLYERLVIPYISKNPNVSVLDFGCGKGAYIKLIADKVRKAIGLEFYNNNGSKINVSMGNRMIDNVIDFVKKEKKFDVCVCDSVLNSVDCMEAEESVIACLNLLTRNKLFISGRRRECMEKYLNSQVERGHEHHNLKFYDENGFTGNYRKGQWYFQKFHYEQDIIKELEKFGFRVDCIKRTNSAYQIECTKVKELDIETYKKAVEYEFNLPLPNGKSYNRHKEVMNALDIC